jgi:hypothetical protein
VADIVTSHSLPLSLHSKLSSALVHSTSGSRLRQQS